MGAHVPVRRIASTLALASLAGLGLALQLHLIDLVGSTGASLRAFEFVLDEAILARRSPRTPPPQGTTVASTPMPAAPAGSPLSREITPPVTVLTPDDERMLLAARGVAHHSDAYFREDGRGVQVHRVPPSSFAARVGLLRGDTVVAIDGHPLGTMDQAVDAARAIRLTRPQVIRVDLVRRGEPRHFYIVRPADPQATPRRAGTST